MEYYIFVTHRCNLACSYCSAGRILSSDKRLALTDDRMEAVIEHISKNNHNQKDTVVFFGGEPLLEPQIIDKFIKKTSDLDLSYILYTNGLLLNSVPFEVLKPMDVIFVSLDGDKKSHEKHRGVGTYEKIINTVKEIKSKLDSFIIGKITVEEETNIYSSVTNIINYVDAVFWQLVNKPKFNNQNLFIKNYNTNLERLFKFWLTRFKQKELLKIIPFQAIISSLIFDYKKDGKSFRCGAGSALQAIDIDGNVYWCDEYVGNPKGIVGHVTDNNPIDLRYKSHKDIFEDCKECEVSDICLGECKKCLMEYSDKQKRVYCNLTRYLIKMILNHIEEIKNEIEKNGYTLIDFYNDPYCTEEIP